MIHNNETRLVLGRFVKDPETGQQEAEVVFGMIPVGTRSLTPDTKATLEPVQKTTETPLQNWSRHFINFWETRRNFDTTGIHSQRGQKNLAKTIWSPRRNQNPGPQAYIIKAASEVTQIARTETPKSQTLTWNVNEFDRELNGVKLPDVIRADSPLAAAVRFVLR